MNTEYAYFLTTKLYFVLYLLGLTLILYLFIRPLFHKKWPPFLVGISYLSTLLFLDFMPIEISNFTAYFSSSVLAFIVMLVSEQGNRAAKFLYAFLFFAVRWLLPKFFEFAQKYSIEPWLLTTNTPISLAVVWSVKYILLFSCFYLICKWLHKALSTIHINAKTAIILSVPACISVLSYLFVMELQLFTLSIKAEFILALFYIGLIGVILLFVRLYVKQEQVKTTLSQEQLLNAQVQVTKQHFAQIETLYGELKGLKHDLTNHFEVIEQLMVNQHYDEAMHYTEKIREQATSLQSFTTGHPVTDVVLQQKQERASCYVLATNGGHPLPFAIYADEQPVGFVMLTYGITGYELPSIANDSYCILRLMIDKQYQNRGYGREAMKEILKFIRTFPAGTARYCWIPYGKDNIAAKKLYESFGFRDNGEICDNEPITVLQL